MSEKESTQSSLPDNKDAQDSNYFYFPEIIVHPSNYDKDGLPNYLGSSPRHTNTVPVINYTFNEDKYLQEISNYINKTYSQHYSQGKYQATDTIIDAGWGEGFCLGNIIKYCKRYGKKDGKSKADLLKIIHYAIIQLHIHDTKE